MKRNDLFQIIISLVVVGVFYTLNGWLKESPDVQAVKGAQVFIYLGVVLIIPFAEFIRAHKFNFPLSHLIIVSAFTIFLAFFSFAIFQGTASKTWRTLAVFLLGGGVIIYIENLELKLGWSYIVKRGLIQFFLTGLILLALA